MSKILGVHSPAKLQNSIKNGNLDFWQALEGNTASVNAATASGYSADMFLYSAGGSTTKVFSLQRSTNVPTFVQSGYQSTYSAQFTMTTAIASLSATDVINPFIHRMEGFDYQKFHGKKGVMGFWFSTTVAGTYSYALQNSGNTRSYVTTFNAVAGYQFVPVSIPFDNQGTWLFDNTVGLQIYVASVAGANASTATLNQWQTGNYVAATGATNYAATAGAVMNVSQLTLVEGGLGLGANGFSRNGATYEEEFSNVRRYYEKSYDNGTAPGAATVSGLIARRFTANNGNTHVYDVMFKTPKRTATAAMTYYDSVGNINKVGIFDQSTDPNNSGTPVTSFIGMTGFSMNHGASCSGSRFHFVADARL